MSGHTPWSEVKHRMPGAPYPTEALGAAIRAGTDVQWFVAGCNGVSEGKRQEGRRAIMAEALRLAAPLIVAEAARAERDRCITELERRGQHGAVAALMESALPSLPQVHAWMRAHGWHPKPPGPAGAMWEHPDAHQIAVPGDDVDRMAVTGAICRLALAADRPVAEVLAEIRAISPALRDAQGGGR